MPQRYDAIVVGAGASGGWAAKELTEAGLAVALLEAGPELSQGSAAGLARAAGTGHQPIQSRSYAFGERTAHLFVDDGENPYSHPDDSPFNWIRGRQVGGRLHVWAGMSLRMSDYELQAAARDGIGPSWPLSYADLAPYYERVERQLRVCGTAERLPQLPDGAFAEPPRLSRGERELKAAVERRWSTRRVTGARIALAPVDATLAAARRTGRLTLYPDSVATRVIVDGDADTARGVAFVECSTHREREIEGRVVVLCASTIESTRLLLNSATADHPRGLANASGVLGHYLMDHTFGVGVDGIAAQRLASAGRQSDHGCAIPAFRNVTEHDVGFARSYGVRLQVHPPVAGGWGRLRARGRRSPGRFWLRAFGEVLPRLENRVTVDRSKPDAWGIPTVRIECRYGDNERLMAADQAHCLREIAEAAGFDVERTHTEPAPPGSSAHELGTARMGRDPASSVLDPHNRAWDVRNLFVTDGACFPTSGWQNPTLTIMALTVRACDHIVEQLRQRRL